MGDEDEGWYGSDVDDVLGKGLMLGAWVRPVTGRRSSSWLLPGARECGAKLVLAYSCGDKVVADGLLS